jgi:hypothetical protein
MPVTLNASTSSGLVQTADTSGIIELQNNGTTRLTVNASGVTIPTLTTTTVTGTIVQGTAVASTSGTSIDFTSIPSWAKRIVVMLNGVSTNGASPVQIQIGSGSVTTSGYSSLFYINTNVSTVTSGFSISGYGNAADARIGVITISLLTGNTYMCNGQVSQTTAIVGHLCGSVALGGVLDRVRITTVNGTDTFDAGTINIQYEG